MVNTGRGWHKRQLTIVFITEANNVQYQKQLLNLVEPRNMQSHYRFSRFSCNITKRDPLGKGHILQFLIYYSFQASLCEWELFCAKLFSTYICYYSYNNLDCCVNASGTMNS